MTALFRRMLSPRDRGRQSDELSQDLPSPLAHGHKNSDTSTIKVDNAIYSEPTQLDSVSPRGTGGEDPHSPFPPSANSDDNDTYYSAPVDTLARDPHLQQLSSKRDRERVQAQERRHLEVHERTLNQMHAIIPSRSASGGGGSAIGHRRTRSGGHIIDNDEYSTPWNAAQEEQKRRQSAPPRKHHHSRRGIPATPNDGIDDIIPVSPPPILSAAHERSQSASPIPQPQSPVVSGADAEYDDPWDVKNRNISQAIPGRHHAHSVHERRPSTPPLINHRSRQSVGSRVDHSRHILTEESRSSRAGSEKILDQFRPRTITDLQSHSLSVATPSSPRTNSVSTPVHPIQRRPLPEEPGSLPTPTNPIRRELSPAPAWFDCKLALEEQT